MTLNELIKDAEEWVDKGYGDKEVIVENGDHDLEVVSIQSNTHWSMEPDYLWINPGAIANIEIRGEFIKDILGK